MCVKILRDEEEVAYDINKPLEQQLKGYKQIVINYEPNDASLEKFLDEIERFCNTGINRVLNIKVMHNDALLGAKAKKTVQKITKGMDVNELIRSLVNAHYEADKKLEELCAMCTGVNSVKS